MRKLPAATALFAVLVLATSATAAATDMRPFRGVTYGTDSYGPPSCAGASWQYHHEGFGEVAHLGRVTVVVDHCTYFDPVAGFATFGPGTITLVAANGDTLILSDWGTATLVMTPEGPTSVVDLFWEVAGGTGRFSDAAGSGGGSPISDIVAGTTTALYWGTISY